MGLKTEANPRVMQNAKVISLIDRMRSKHALSEFNVVYARAGDELRFSLQDRVGGIGRPFSVVHEQTDSPYTMWLAGKNGPPTSVSEDVIVAYNRLRTELSHIGLAELVCYHVDLLDFSGPHGQRLRTKQLFYRDGEFFEEVPPVTRQ